MLQLLVWIAGGLLLWLPGVALNTPFHFRREVDPFVRLAMQLGVGISFWPVLFLWTSQIGWRWSRVGVTALLLALTAAAVRAIRLPRTAPYLAISYVALFAAAIVSRVLQARDLAFPPWVDSVHHAMIVRLLIDGGRIPLTLDPYISHGQFYYHWGYHALVAFLCWFLGLTDPLQLPTVMLAFGQLLNSLAFMMLYAGGRVLFRSRGAGLAAATLGTTIAVFPAFYLSWGRYTHLTGILLLPPLLIALWRLAERPSGRGALLVALIAAGLFLIHVRVAFFAAVAAPVLAIAAGMSGRKKFARAWAAAAAVTLLVAAPWLARLAANRHVSEFVHPGSVQRDDEYSVLPFEDLFVQNNAELISIATCGVSGMAGLFEMPFSGRVLSALWWLLIIFAMWRPRRTGAGAAPWKPLLIVATMIVAIALILQLRAGGVVFTRFASVSSAVITLFLPIALVAGGLIAWVAARLLQRRRATIAVAAGLALAAIYGVLTSRSIVAPVTILADADDLAAMQWIRKNTPAEARFAVNAAPWMENAYIGTDGGYWIPIIAGRSSIIPPALYAWTLPPRDVTAINRVAEAWMNDLRIDDPAVTHIYTNRRRDNGRWRAIAQMPGTRLVYARGEVRIFVFRRTDLTSPSP